uniref:non-specific serine/threonine protein kinase n=1 Tax=Lotharella oceanica TaxID=641309 RepID=A0A7S2TG11_9EUKA
MGNKQGKGSRESGGAKSPVSPSEGKAKGGKDFLEAPQKPGEYNTNSYGKGYEPAGNDVLNTKMTIDDFELMKVVGKGSFGKVYQVKYKKTGEIFALKSLKKQQLLKRKQIEHTQTERKVLQQMQHPFIVSLKFAFQTKDRLYMVLEYFTGGELFYHLKTGGRFGYRRAKFYATEICLALECLHDAGIIYRDLKPENILLDDEGHVRLTDFGLSKDCVLGNQETKTFCGTPEYLAPEVILGKPYTKAVDWWSFGTVVFEMTCGLPPFYHKNVKAMYERILSAPLRFPKGMPEAGKQFFSGLLERDPKRRLGSKGGAAEVKKCLYFADVNWKEMLEKKVEPEFKPQKQAGKQDTINVDPDFLREMPRETPMERSELATEAASSAFPGFTYQEPGEMLS